MNLDDELRGLLLTRADDAPSGAGMLDDVRVLVRRRGMRTRAGVAGAAVAVAVALVIGTPYLLAPLRSGSGGGAGPVASGIQSQGPGPELSEPPPTSRPSTVELSPTAFRPLAFPLSPQWTPPGVGQPTVGRNESQVRLQYLWQASSLIATIGAELMDPGWQPVTTQPTTVGTRPATLTTGTNTDGKPAVRVTWQLDDQWVDLEGSGTLNKTQVERYADNLRRQPLVIPPPFTLALAPVGYQVTFQEIHPELTPDEFYFCLAPSANLNDNEAFLCVTRRADSAQPTGGEPVQVGSHPGEMTREEGRLTLAVHQPGFDFTVSEGQNGPLSEDDLIRFAAGIAKR